MKVRVNKTVFLSLEMTADSLEQAWEEATTFANEDYFVMEELVEVFPLEDLN